MKITTKLAASTLALVALLLGSIMTTFAVMQTMESSLQTIVADRLIATKGLKEIGDLYAVSIVDTAHKVRSGALSWEDGAKSIDASLAKSAELWKDYLATYLTPEEATLARETAASIETGNRPIADLRRIIGARDMPQAEAFIGSQLYPAVDPITEHISQLVSLQMRVGLEEFQRAKDNKQMNFRLLAVFSALAFAVSAASLWTIFRGVSKPLGVMTGRMQQLAAGDTSIDIPFVDKKDEVGAIAGALETFRQAALGKIALENLAEENRKRAEAERLETQRQAEADAAERLRIATAGLAAGLKQLAAGDLTVALNEPFASDFEQLRHDFNTSVKQLRSTLNQVSHAVTTMDGGTREIADGANDLSKRTEQQAAALEETAAALDEITTNVANSSKRTDEARKVANTANNSATQSAKVVADAEEAMRRIEESSQQISNIIGVIDEIAFQTNLLALNAGVEAARAGETGKGFAVVAQEVRELAQRSAKAAKEIKTLIENASTEVDHGVKLVRETGMSLKTIGGYIIEINSHVSEIATSAKEQSTGLQQVNVSMSSDRCIRKRREYPGFRGNS